MSEAVKVEVLLQNATKTIGEAPHWEEKSGKLLYVDILNNTVHRLHVETGAVECHTLDGFTSLIVPTETDNVYLVSSLRKLCRLDWTSGDLQVVSEVPLVGTNNRFNDGKCDAEGRLWAGTMGHMIKPGQIELDKGRLFCLDKDKLRDVYGPVSISNGLAWSADNSIMYYIDTAPRQVYAFNYDISTGDISSKRIAVDFANYSMEEAGKPDGMAIDQDGKLWIAGFLGGKVMQFDPETGKMLRYVAIPGKRTTSCCFGGKDFSELYVTSGRTGWTEEELRTVDPLAGSIFRVTGLGCKGTAAYSYRSC